MKKFISILSAIVLVLCSIPFTMLTFADTTETTVSSDWVVFEDFDGDDGKVTSDYVVYGSSSAFYVTDKNGNAWQKTLGGTYSGPEFKFPNIQQYVPGAYYKDVWFKYDLMGPAVFDTTKNGTFKVEFYFYDGTTKFRMASADDAEKLGIEEGYFYYRTNGDVNWTKGFGYYATLPDDFNGEIMFPLANFCINKDAGTLATTYMNIESSSFKDTFMYSNMAAGEKFAVDNFSVSAKDMTPVWTIVEDFDGDGDKTTANYVVNGGSSAFYDNDENGNAWQKTLTTSYSSPNFWLPNMQKYIPGVSYRKMWYKFDLIGPAALDSSISATNTFRVQFYFNDTYAQYRMPYNSEVEKYGIAQGYCYYRSKGETNWTKATGWDIYLPNNFNGEIMFPLSNFCIDVTHGNILATQDINIANNYFKDEFMYSDMTAGEKFAVDNICITDKNMTPVRSALNDDLQWVVAEDFDGDGDKTTVEYVVNGSSSAFYDNGENGNAWQKNLTTTYCGPNFWLPNIQKYIPGVSQKDAWFKFDLIGPAVLDSNVTATEKFRVQFYFNDTYAQYRMPYKSEAGKYGINPGYCYYRAKGETDWTKYIGWDIYLLNDFDGEIMFPLSNFCIDVTHGNILATQDMLLNNDWFKDEFMFSDMAAGESFAIDNISVANGKFGDFVASADGVLCTSVQNAVLTAKEEITLSGDVDLSDSAKIYLAGLTLDLNGYTVITSDTALEITGTGYTVKNGTIGNVTIATSAVFDNVSGNISLATGYGAKLLDEVLTVDTCVAIADIDASGSVNATDACSLRKILLETSDDNVNYDINGDSFYDIRDLVRLKKLIVEEA